MSSLGWLIDNLLHAAPGLLSSVAGDEINDIVRTEAAGDGHRNVVGQVVVGQVVASQINERLFG